MNTDAAPYLAGAQVSEVKAAWRAAVRGADPGLSDFAERLLRRIAPPRWSLEWSLPGWLADAFHLSPTHAQSLTLANVFGLGYVRLQDDLLDRDLAAGDDAPAIALSALLYLEWARLMAAAVGPDEDFWRAAARFMGQWSSATRRSVATAPVPFAHCTEEEFRQLAHRGAPLKICIAATCALAHCADRLPALDDALDHLLAAEVLLDHAHDWEQDVRAERYNLFLSCVSATPQAHAYLAEHRRLVTADRVIGSAACSYFDAIDRRLSAAAESALLGGLPRLAAHAQTMAVLLRKRLAAAKARIRAALQAAVAEVWSATTPIPTSGAVREEHTMEGASSTELEMIIGKAFMDPAFNAWLLKDPAAAAASINIKLSEEQVKQILALDADALNKLTEQFRELIGIGDPKWMDIW